MHISSGVLCASPIIYRSQQLFSSRKQTCWLPFQKASAMGRMDAAHPNHQQAGCCCCVSDALGTYRCKLQETDLPHAFPHQAAVHS